MRARVLAALAIADFRERTRRPAYLVTLAAAVGLGYLALPPATSLWVIMDAGGYRGSYNSAYVGTVSALAGTLWLMLGGFYVVRGAIVRDQRTRVGQILATTPLTTVDYLTGKLVSNLLVLASMTGVLAVTALVLQAVRGESTAVDPVALLLPFVLVTLPVMAVTSAAAVLFETVPVLRSGVGNVCWFFLWMVVATAGSGVPLGGLGEVAASMRRAMAAQGLPGAAEFSVGLTRVDHPLRVFTWHGLDPSGGFVVSRLVLVVVAVGLAVLPALWFGRFDPARTRPRPGPGGAAGPAVPAPGTLPEPVAVAAPHRPRALAYRPLSSGRARPRLAFWRLLSGEFRILARGAPGWWWLVVAVLNAACLVVPTGLAEPGDDVATVLLAVAWLWPVLVWSRLGTQRHENGLETLLGAYPARYRQVLAEWSAGVVLTAVTGLGPAVRMVVASDTPRVAAWAAGLLFIPSLALALGTVTRSHRLFQVAHVAMWYAAVNQVAAVDYLGVVLVDDRPAGPPPPVTAGVSLALLAATLAVRAARHAGR